MRLIDADKIHWEYKCISKEEIDDEPTVKAIPVEFIEKWVEKFYKVINGKKYYNGDGYDTVWDLLEDWEKENE